MRRIINNLQQKSLDTRRHILLVSSFGITSLVVLIWVVTLSVTHKPVAQVEKESVAKPFELLKDNIIKVYANAQTGFEDAKKTIGTE